MSTTTEPTTATYDRDFANWIKGLKPKAVATPTEAPSEWTVFCRPLEITVKVTARSVAEARRVFKRQYGANATSVLVER